MLPQKGVSPAQLELRLNSECGQDHRDGLEGWSLPPERGGDSGGPAPTGQAAGGLRGTQPG